MNLTEKQATSIAKKLKARKRTFLGFYPIYYNPHGIEGYIKIVCPKTNTEASYWFDVSMSDEEVYVSVDEYPSEACNTISVVNTLLIHNAMNKC